MMNNDGSSESYLYVIYYALCMTFIFIFDNDDNYDDNYDGYYDGNNNKTFFYWIQFNPIQLKLLRRGDQYIYSNTDHTCAVG